MGPTTPIIKVPGRTFPVTPYFLEDAVELSKYHLEMESDSPYVERLRRKALLCVQAQSYR
jgi:ATP-dependent RNA helicase DHX29